MRIVYTGPHAEGVLAYPPDGGEIHAEPGKPIEVDDKFGASLLEQPSNWQPAPKVLADKKPAETGGKE